MVFYNFQYLLWVAPAILLMMWAQFRIRSAYARGMQVPASLTGAAAAQHILDSEGLDNVAVEMTEGVMSDHYDPSAEGAAAESRRLFAAGRQPPSALRPTRPAMPFRTPRTTRPMAIRNIAVPAASSDQVSACSC